MKPFSFAHLMMVILKCPFTSLVNEIKYSEKLDEFTLEVVTNGLTGEIGIVTLSKGLCDALGLKTPNDVFDIKSLPEGGIINIFNNAYVVSNEIIDEDGDPAFSMTIVTADEYNTQVVKPVATELLPA